MPNIASLCFRRGLRPCPWLVLFLMLCLSPLPAAPAPAPGVSVENGQHYQRLFGHPYRTLQPLYVFIFHDDVDHIYLGAHERAGLGELPESVRPENVGRKFGAIQILAVVPAGAVLTLKAETHETLRASGIWTKGGIPLGFIAQLAHPGNQFDGVLTEFIQTATPAAAGTLNQHLDPTMAAPLE